MRTDNNGSNIPQICQPITTAAHNSCHGFLQLQSASATPAIAMLNSRTLPIASSSSRASATSVHADDETGRPTLCKPWLPFLEAVGECILIEI